MRSRAIMIVNVQDRQSRGGVGARRRLGGALGWWGPKRKPASLYYPRMRVREEKRACFWPPPPPPPTPGQRPAPHRPTPDHPASAAPLHHPITPSHYRSWSFRFIIALAGPGEGLQARLIARLRTKGDFYTQNRDAVRWI